MNLKRIITVLVACLHWLLYGLVMLSVIMINAETWFFGIKINGDAAILIHLVYGISGFAVGYFVYRQKKIAYVFATVLFVFMMISFRV